MSLGFIEMEQSFLRADLLLEFGPRLGRQREVTKAADEFDRVVGGGEVVAGVACAVTESVFNGDVLGVASALYPQKTYGQVRDRMVNKGERRIA